MVIVRARVLRRRQIANVPNSMNFRNSLNNLNEMLQWYKSSKMPLNDSLMLYSKEKTFQTLQNSINLDFVLNEDNFDDLMPDEMFYEIPDLSSSKLCMRLILAADVKEHERNAPNIDIESNAHNAYIELNDDESDPFMPKKSRLNNAVHPAKLEEELKTLLEMKNQLSNRLCDLLDSSYDLDELNRLKADRKNLELSITEIRAKIDMSKQHSSNSYEKSNNQSFCNNIEALNNPLPHEISSNHLVKSLLNNLSIEVFNNNQSPLSSNQSMIKKEENNANFPKKQFPWTKYVKKALREYLFQ